MFIFIVVVSVVVCLTLGNLKKNTGDTGNIGLIGITLGFIGKGTLLFLVYIMCIVIENTLIEGKIRQGAVFILLAMMLAGTLWLKLERVLYFSINEKHNQDKLPEVPLSKKSKEETHDQ